MYSQGGWEDNRIIFEFDANLVHRLKIVHHSLFEEVDEIIGKGLILSTFVEWTQDFNEMIQGSFTPNDFRPF